jgi:hypothetical protein
MLLYYGLFCRVAFRRTGCFNPPRYRKLVAGHRSSKSLSSATTVPIQASVERHPRYVTHRGVVHSLLAALIAAFAVWVVALFHDLETLAVACFFLGFISHLAADSLKPTGIKCLQPVSKAKLKDGVRTGSAMEKLFFLLVVAAISVILCLPDIFPELSSLWLWHII